MALKFGVSINKSVQKKEISNKRRVEKTTRILPTKRKEKKKLTASNLKFLRSLKAI